MKEFKELLLDNALFKVQNQALINKNPKWKEWWQIVHEITKEHIEDNLEIVCVDEEAYLNKLVSYHLQFEGYTCDQLSNKLVEVLIIVSYKFSHVQASITTTSSWSEPVVTTIEESEPIRRGVEITIVFLYFVFAHKICGSTCCGCQYSSERIGRTYYS